MILSKAFRNESRPVLTLDNTDGWFENLGSPPEAVNMKNALMLSPIAAAHRILTNSMGALPVKVYKKTGEGREDINHSLDYVLSVRASQNMSPFTQRKLLMSQAFWYGDGFAYISRDKWGNVTELLPLPSETMQAYKDESGQVWYSFSVGNEVRKFPNDQLLHIMFDSVDGLTGRGMLAIAKETIANDRAGQKYSGKFYTNGARPSGIITVKSKLEPDAKNKVRTEFERMTGGMDNAFRVAVMDLGMEYTPVGISQRDAQYIESRNFTVEEVSRFTGVPLYKLQQGKQSYESNEQQGIDYVTGTLQPHVIQWEQEFRYKLLTIKEIQSGIYVKFNMAAEMRGDNQSRGNFYQRMIQNGIYSINDCLDFEDMNRIENGDRHWMTKNYDTIENIIQGRSGKNGAKA